METVRVMDGWGEAGPALSPAQRRLWATDGRAPDRSSWTASVVLRCSGPLDVEAVRRAVVATVQRQEGWGSEVAWSFVDHAATAAPERQAEVLRRAQEEVRPFAVSGEPLVRALVQRVGEEDHRVVLTVARLVADPAVVHRVVLPELARLVQGTPAPSTPASGPSPSTTAAADGGKDAVARDLEFWRQALVGVPTVITVPGSAPAGPGRRAPRGAAREFALGAELSQGVRALCAREGTTPATALSGAFGALLHRTSGQDEVLVGVEPPEPGEPGGSAGGMVVLRVDLSGAPTVSEMLARTESAWQAAWDHRGAPFEAVAEALGCEVGPGHHPLVQVVVAFAPPEPPLPPGWAVVRSGAPADTVEVDLRLELDTTGDEVTGRLLYDPGVLPPAGAERMVAHWLLLLEGAVAAPGARVGELSLLSPSERHVLLGAWGRGPGVVGGADVALLVAEQAAARPDAVAVVCEGEELTYGQLDRRANQLARHLRTEGVKPEVPVGVCMDRSVDQVTALLGILKAGGVYVPLDPEAPPERIRYVLDDTEMPVVLTQHHLAGRLGSTDAVVVSLDRSWSLIGRQSDAEPDDLPEDDHLAYIVYTSGSTGQPKGVMIERGAISGHSRSMAARYGLTAEDRVLQFSLHTADASLEQILPTLVTGARLVMRGREIWTPAELLGQVAEHGVTVANLWPAYLQQAVRAWAGRRDELAATRLRLVVVGGERLRGVTVRGWEQLGLDHVPLLNAYGPTECTITATLAEVGGAHEAVTIGRPLPGRTLYVLDPGGQPVPAGVAGELHVGGPLLGRGYLGRDELTAQRFVPDPFGPDPGGRLYRTGDMVRYLPDGRLEYLGRQDEQVKIRGYRIELGEIESVLVRHPAVDEAVVVARTEGDETYLAAYVLVDAPGSHQAELRRHLESALPRHMQPAVVEEMGAFPRLASGKPDRKRMPETPWRSRRADTPYVAPRVMVEHRVVSIWEELLEARPIGITDNFFHVGGHSLLAAQLVARLEEEFGTRVALSTLFARPTVEGLARELESQAVGHDGRGRVLPVQAHGSRRPLFFLHGDWTGGAFYCFALARGCGPEQPFYVLEPYAFSPREAVPTVEEMAAEHVRAMRGIQGHGPYRLGGFCNGGLLAYEMARQLEAAGEEVEYLGLVNPSVPIQVSRLRQACAALSAVAGRAEAGPGLYLRARHALRHLYRRSFPGGARVQDFGELLRLEPRLASAFPPREALVRDYVGVLSWTAAAYRTGIFGGRISCYWAEDEPAIRRSWEPLLRVKRAADVEETVLPGTHMASVTDGVAELAASMGADLERLERRRPAAGS